MKSPWECFVGARGYPSRWRSIRAMSPHLPLSRRLPEKLRSEGGIRVVVREDFELLARERQQSVAGINDPHDEMRVAAIPGLHELFIVVAPYDSDDAAILPIERHFFQKSRPRPRR